MKRITAFVAALIIASPIAVAVHGGRTDKNGCHINRKTGERHCHRPRGGSSVAPPLI